MDKSSIAADSLFPTVNLNALQYLARVKVANVVCYLDFDGVLHGPNVYRHPRDGITLGGANSAGRRLFEHARSLEDVLQPFPQVRIVLSTDWVRRLGFSRTRSFLPSLLAARVIGATYHAAAHGRDDVMRNSFEQSSRAEQILADVKRRRPISWFAIDDDTSDWPDAHRSNLIECTGDSGLGSAAAMAALAQALSAIAKIE